MAFADNLEGTVGLEAAGAKDLATVVGAIELLKADGVATGGLAAEGTGVEIGVATLSLAAGGTDVEIGVDIGDLARGCT